MEDNATQRKPFIPPLSPSHLPCGVLINLPIELHSFTYFKVHIDCLFVAWAVYLLWLNYFVFVFFSCLELN